MANIGVVTDEMINLAGSRTGGFGWATRTLHGELRDHPSLGGAPTVLTRSRSVRRANGRRGRVDGEGSRHDLLVLGTSPRRDPVTAARIMARRFRGLALIDYRPTYEPILDVCPHVPLLLWVRDPKGPEEQSRLETLREPGFPGERPHGVGRIHTERFAEVAAARAGVAGHRLAVVTPFLRERVPGAYGVGAEGAVHLPNIFPPVSVRDEDRAAGPTVVLLGRLDPVKRIWVAVEVARRMPHVRFLVAGTEHAGSRWAPTALPDNIEFLGEVFGRDKDALLRKAWVLLNTSIHEGLPVTFQEALAYQVPVVSYLDPEHVPSRFGAAAGFEPGDGLGGVDRLRDALSGLLDDHEHRMHLGRDGQAWVSATHNRQRFHEAWAAATRGWSADEIRVAGA